MPDLEYVPMHRCAQQDHPCREVTSSRDPSIQYMTCIGDERRPPSCTCDGFKYNAMKEWCKVCGEYRERHSRRQVFLDAHPHDFDPELREFECRHIKDLRLAICSYNEDMDGPPKIRRGKLVCPKCGGPVSQVLVAV